MQTTLLLIKSIQFSTSADKNKELKLRSVVLGSCTHTIGNDPDGCKIRKSMNGLPEYK